MFYKLFIAFCIGIASIYLAAHPPINILGLAGAALVTVNAWAAADLQIQQLLQ
jgi:hypothetical protein